MAAATGRPAAFARHEAAGRLEALRLAVRFATHDDASRNEDGSVDGLASDVAPLRIGHQQLGPFAFQVAADASGDAARFDLIVHNPGSAVVHLESVVLGFRWTGAPTEALRFLRHGWQSWSYTASRSLDPAGEPPFPSGPWLRGMHHGVGAPAADRVGWHESDLVSVVGVAPSGPCCLAGVLERGQATSLVYLRRDGESVLVEVEQRLERPVPPGGKLALETVRVALGVDASRLLETHAEEHGSDAGARTTSPFQAGWCTWYHFFHDVTEADFLRNLDAIAARRSEIPIDIVQLDDGYQRAIGDWLDTNDRFPHGLAPLAAAVRSAGFRPGLWTAPFCVTPDSRVFAEHPEWLLRRGDEFHRGLLHPAWFKDGSVHVLDTSRDDVCEHLVQTFDTLTEWGFGYHKIDFLYVAAMQAVANDPQVTRAGRLRRGLEAIRRGIGEEAFLLGCGCPLGPAVGVVDGMRIGPDVAPYWNVDPDTAIPGIEAAQPSTRNAVRSVVNRAWMHRRLWLNDPDCLMARTRETRLSAAEVGTLAAAIAATGGMVVFSDDVPVLSDDDVARVRDTVVLAREVDAAGIRGTATVPDLLAQEIPGVLTGGTSTGALVALINADDASGTRAVSTIALGYPDARVETAPLLHTASVRSDSGEIRAELGSHETALLRLRRASRIAVFCDFDGTFAVQDVGATLARRYAAERRAALWDRLANGELRAWEYNMELLDGLPLPQDDLDAFLRTVDLSPGAAELIAWCEQHNAPFRVLSDGFDRNLDRLQELSGVRFAYDANRLWYDGDVWRIAAGHPDPSCECGTGVCKRARIRLFRADHPEAKVVHVGNGRVSDLCASLAADVVFAKDTLAEELEERGIPFETFENLHDVIAGLERLAASIDRA